MKSLFIAFYVFLGFIQHLDIVSCHGYLIEPAARSSAWRIDKRYPIYYNDNEMYCGGYTVQWDQNNGKCGICGENYAKPKRFEKGGDYYTGVSVRQYKKGDTIDVRVIITANHLGWFEFKICNNDGSSTDATQACLDKTVLKNINGLTRIQINGSVSTYTSKLVLPPKLSCKHCVLQWKYHTGNRWGIDPSGKGCLGCGARQEEFYGCADITIVDPLSPTRYTTKKMITTRSMPKPYYLEPEIDIPCSHGDGYYADYSTNCRSYHLCSLSQTPLKTIKTYWCEEGLIFDDEAKNCNWPSKANCTLKVDEFSI